MARETTRPRVKSAKGEVEILLRQLPGMQAGELFIELAGLLGPGFAALGVAMTDETGRTDEVPTAVREFFSRLDRAKFRAITLELLDGSRANVEGEFVDLDKSGIDSLFRGRVASLYLLLWLALRENYSSFFEDLGLSLGQDFQKKILQRISEAMGETKKNEQTEKRPND